MSSRCHAHVKCHGRAMAFKWQYKRRRKSSIIRDLLHLESHIRSNLLKKAHPVKPQHPIKMSTTCLTRLARRALLSGSRISQPLSSRTLTTSARLSANTPSKAGQHISQVAQSEGGTSQGSQSAQMQSELTRQRNYEQAAQQVGQKLQNDPSSVTAQEANRVS